MKFDDVDQELLMLLAGELSSSRARELAHEIENDVALSRRFAALSEAMDATWRHLEAADAARPLAVAGDVEARRIGRAMRQFQADRLSRPAQPAIARRRRLPMWVYPISAAALLTVGFLVWWTYRPVPFAPEQITQADPDQQGPDGPADSTPTTGPALTEENSDSAVADVVVRSFSLGESERADAERAGVMSLTEAERTAASLAASSDSILSDDSVDQ